MTGIAHALEPLGGRLCERQDHGLAPGRGKLVVGCAAHESPAIPVRNDEAGFLRKDLGGKVGIDCEIEIESYLSNLG